MTAGVLEPSVVRADFERKVAEVSDKALGLLADGPQPLSKVVEDLYATGIRDSDVIARAILDLLAHGRVDLDEERALHAL